MARSDLHKTFPFPLKIISLMMLIAVSFIDQKINSVDGFGKGIINQVFSAYKPPDPFQKAIIVTSASKKIKKTISRE